MNIINNIDKWQKFIENHGREKRYVHFDEKCISLNQNSVKKYVENKNKIAKHGFYPFIHFTKNLTSFSQKKKKKKIREIFYCAHLDRCVYQRYSFLINQRYNQKLLLNGIDNVSIAYRDNKSKNNINFAKEAFDLIKKHDKMGILIGDFTDFFDRLDHLYLKERLCDLLETDKLPEDYYNVFKRITKYSYWDWKLLVERAGYKLTMLDVRKKLAQQKTIISKEIFNKHKNDIKKNMKSYGIPQGSPISAVLANVYMLEFDKKISNYVSKRNGYYFRYSDDFIIMLPIEKEAEIYDIKNDVFSIRSTIPRLLLKQEKTHLYMYEKKQIIAYPEKEISQIKYLGFIFDGEGIKIRPKTITKYYYRMQRKAYNYGKNYREKSNDDKNGVIKPARKLYAIYGKNKKNKKDKNNKQTFIDYAQKATRVLRLNDNETKAIIKFYKQKIALAIKKGKK